MSSPPPPPKRGHAPTPRQMAGGLVLLAVVSGGLVAYFLWPRPKPTPDPTPDLTAAVAANTRGVGRMDRFEFAEAEAAFAEAARLAPDWPAARINLAIALFNQDTPAKLARARQLFTDVLAADPDNNHAHFCLGILCAERTPFAEAYPHFAAVNRLDPDDPHTWFRMGLTHPAGPRSADAERCFAEALTRDPYLNAARYNLLQCVQDRDPARAKELEQEFVRLKAATWETEAGIRYGVMGKYADVIGRDPAAAGKPEVGPLPPFGTPAGLRVNLEPGWQWVGADKPFGWFGETVVLFDYNRDGRPDIFCGAAVKKDGRHRNLLLRNDGNFTFTDVTAAAGLAVPLAFAAAGGDFDNDGYPDLAIVSHESVSLCRNRGNGSFEHTILAQSGENLNHFFGRCGWVDLDQDADLDLIVSRTVPNPSVDVFENVGEALPGKPGLTAKFVRRDAATFPAAKQPSALVVSDLDADRDLDVLVLDRDGPPLFLANDRLMRFRRADPPTPTAANWTGGLTLDANHDERSDLFLLRADGPPVFLLSKGERGFTPGATNSPPLKQAVAADVDMDGWPDVVGLTADGKAVLLHDRGDGRLELAPDAFGTADQLPAAAHAVAVADLDGDAMPDLLLWSDAGLHVRRNEGNGNSAVLVDPTGRRDKGSDQRTNADGIGCWVVAQTGPHWTGAERATVTAGPGQSLLPIGLGLGRHGRADVVRVRWPDGVIQAELGAAGGTRFPVVETNRKGTSCPVLMGWDGERFAFVTDFLGGGALGESGPDGAVRPPRGEESVKIEPGQLKPRDGHFVLKIAEPMDEVLYLDRLRLDVIDHPKDVAVYPDERFTLGGPPPSQNLLAFRQRFVPKAATDHRGRDVLDRLQLRDRRAVDGFARRAWLGYAEDHSLTLDFGELPANAGGRWFLVLAGWTEYPYPESIYAATRAGVPLTAPAVERLAADGATWEPAADLGFPAGLPRVMTRELPGFRGGGRCVLRIRTNMQVFWDHIFLAPAADLAGTAKVTPLAPAAASLAARGFMQEVYPDGRPPVAYDDARTEPVAVTRWHGNLTRLGDVTELLAEHDDRFVLCGPGDEIAVKFDAGKLPPLPAGRERSFVLRTWGYCKDTSPTTVTGGRVGPLPFRGMPNYPDFGAAKPPATDAEKWHTRPAGGR